jgi:hypothetical protein
MLTTKYDSFFTLESCTFVVGKQEGGDSKLHSASDKHANKKCATFSSDASLLLCYYLLC